MAWEKLGSTSVGGGSSDPVNNSWKELGRTTLGSANATIDTGAFTAKDNIMILGHIIPTASNAPNYRVNSDTGSNYAQRYSDNGAADTTDTSNTVWYYDTGAATANPKFTVSTMSNISAQEKLGIDYTIDSGASGAGNTPTRREGVSKWANTSSQITSVQAIANTSTFASGSEVVVLGCDNDEADSGTNKWEELLNESGTGNIATSTFTAKKYLMFDIHIVATGSRCQPVLRFNGDTGSNYTTRFSHNGAADGTNTSTAYIVTQDTMPGNANTKISGSIINTSSNEKLVISHQVANEADTAGASSVMDRTESFAKWANTSAQITSIQTIMNTGTISTWETKVWGFD